MGVEEFIWLGWRPFGFDKGRSLFISGVFFLFLVVRCCVNSECVVLALPLGARARVFRGWLPSKHSPIGWLSSPSHHCSHCKNTILTQDNDSNSCKFDPFTKERLGNRLAIYVKGPCSSVYHAHPKHSLTLSPIPHFGRFRGCIMSDRPPCPQRQEANPLLACPYNSYPIAHYYALERSSFVLIPMIPRHGHDKGIVHQICLGLRTTISIMSFCLQLCYLISAITPCRSSRFFLALSFSNFC